MEEERVVQLLHELPRERALVGFTARVLRRLDEGELGPRPISARLYTRRLSHRNRWTAATAMLTVACLSVVLLQREHTPPAFSPLPTSSPASTTATAATAANTANSSMASAASIDSPQPLSLSPFSSRSSATAATLSSIQAVRSTTSGGAGMASNPRQDLQAMALGATPGAAGNFAGLDSTHARQELRAIRLERVRLEEELHSLRRPTGRSYSAPPAIVYLGGDESVDLVLNTGRMRGKIISPQVEHNPDDNNFLD